MCLSAEVEEELKSAEQSELVGLSGSSSLEQTGSAPSGSVCSPVSSLLRRVSNVCSTFLRRFFSRVFLTCFSMTFLAEWGDRSQIATIALAAQKDPVGVTVGGILGHAICTGIAVLGGKIMAARISERNVSFTGGVLFLIFGMHSLYFGADQ